MNISDALTEKMQEASEEMRFEDAAECRDLIQSIRKIGERQKITAYGEEDRDIIAVAMDESLDLREQDAVVQVFFMRSGRLIGRDHFYLRVARGDTKSQVLSSFLKQFYAGTPFIPKEIMLQTEVEDREVIENRGFIFLFPKKAQRKSWWSLPARMPAWFLIRTVSALKGKRAGPSGLSMKWRNGWD